VGKQVARVPGLRALGSNRKGRELGSGGGGGGKAWMSTFLEGDGDGRRE